MPEISQKTLDEWADAIQENCGNGESFNVTLYTLALEIREPNAYYKAHCSYCKRVHDSRVACNEYIKTLPAADGATDTP